MRLIQSTNLREPSYAEMERALGYQSEQLYLPDGVPPDKVQMIKVPNTRKSTPGIDAWIRDEWHRKVEDAAQKYNKNDVKIDVKYKDGRPNAICEVMDDGRQVVRMFDGRRARFEGAEHDTESGNVRILWSEDNYSTHDALRGSGLPKPYQAQLYTINGAVICRYEGSPAVIIGERDPLRTDQGKIPLFVPAGFIDTKYIAGEQYAQNIGEATINRLLAELDIPGTHSTNSPFDQVKHEGLEELNAGRFDPTKMIMLSNIYNSYANHDTTAIVRVPIDSDFSDIKLRGQEHLRMFPVPLKYETLVNFLYELSKNLNNNSGHLRGGIASLIGHEYGFDVYKQALEDVVIKMSRVRAQ